MSISSPAPKPAVAPKTDPRSSAIETSETSTMSAVPPSGVYAETIVTCTSAATKTIAKTLSESTITGPSPASSARGRGRTCSDDRFANGCTWMVL